jgi:hypothetical protein
LLLRHADSLGVHVADVKAVVDIVIAFIELTKKSFARGEEEERREAIAVLDRLAESR